MQLIEMNKRINIGINVLRVWMAMEVILLHRMSWKGYDGPFFNFLKSCELFSVPVFVIIAFYYSVGIFDKNDEVKLFKRLVRLIIPQVGWALICWVTYYLTDIVFLHKVNHTISDFLIAIVSGCRQNTNPSTWFQAVLILLTLYFALIFKVFKRKNAWMMVWVSMIVSLFIQHNGAYYELFINTNYELANTVGRLFEIMPFACAGMILKSLGVENISTDKKRMAVIMLVLFFFAGFKIPFPQFSKGFYDGFYPLYMGVILFVFFLFLPLDIDNTKLRTVFAYSTKFTLGIYCSHRLIYGILEIVYELLAINISSLSRCLVTYIVCYVLSLIMYQLPSKTIKNLVD